MTVQPQTQPEIGQFAVFLAQHLAGRSNEEISAEFHQLLAAVNEHGKKGSLSIKVTVEPPKGHVDGAPVVISVDSDLKAPKASAPPALYFVDDDGHATRQDPRQLQAFDVRDVTTTTEIKDI